MDIYTIPKLFFPDRALDLPLAVPTWLLLMESQSISIKERKKFASDIIPLAESQLISL